MKAEIGKILQKLCDRKAIEMIAAQCCPNHIHMLIGIPSKYSVSEIVGYLKKSYLIILTDIQMKNINYGNKTFWCRGYDVDTTEKIREYINNQLKKDSITDKISFSEHIEPFTSTKVKANK